MNRRTLSTLVTVITLLGAADVAVGGVHLAIGSALRRYAVPDE